MAYPQLILIRHGQTDWNAERRFQGQRDIPLNSVGRSQAHGNGRTLKSWFAISGQDPDQFRWLASPLGRCCSTMETVQEVVGVQSRSYITDQRLKEITFGDWEGSTSDNLKVYEADLWKQRKADKWSFVPPNGESYEMLSDRVREFVDYALDADPMDTVVVSHGGVMRVLQGLLLGVQPERQPELLIAQDRILIVDRERLRGVWV